MEKYITMELKMLESEWRIVLAALPRMASDFEQRPGLTLSQAVEFSRIRQSALGAYHTIALKAYREFYK